MLHSTNAWPRRPDCGSPPASARPPQGHPRPRGTRADRPADQRATGGARSARAARRARHRIGTPRASLHHRINQRVVQFFDAGLVEEVRRCKRPPNRCASVAAQAIGYREVIAMLAGEASLGQTIELIQVRTRQFAKRQATWFRGLEEVRSLALVPDQGPETDRRTPASTHRGSGKSSRDPQLDLSRFRIICYQSRHGMTPSWYARSCASCQAGKPYSLS